MPITRDLLLGRREGDVEHDPYWIHSATCVIVEGVRSWIVVYTVYIGMRYYIINIPTSVMQ